MNFETLAAKSGASGRTSLRERQVEDGPLFTAGKYGGRASQTLGSIGPPSVRLVHREAANGQESLVKYGPEFRAKTRTLKNRSELPAKFSLTFGSGGKLGSFTVVHPTKTWG